jgi:hypothetical protein
LSSGAIYSGRLLGVIVGTNDVLKVATPKFCILRRDPL